MNRLRWAFAVASFVVAYFTQGCGSDPSVERNSSDPELQVFNNSDKWHLVVQIGVPDGVMKTLDVLPPAAEIRQPLSASTGTLCPSCVLVRAFLFDGDPSMMTEDEMESRLSASVEELLNPCPDAENILAFTISLINSPQGEGIIQFAGRDLLRRVDFCGPTASGPPNSTEILPAKLECICGRVVQHANERTIGVPRIGIMLRPVIRDIPFARSACELDGLDSCELETATCARTCSTSFSACRRDPRREGVAYCSPRDGDVFSGNPIAATTTDDCGRFCIPCPIGKYAVYPFADDVLFRPGHVLVESPAGNVIILAEFDAGAAPTEPDPGTDCAALQEATCP